MYKFKKKQNSSENNHSLMLIDVQIGKQSISDKKLEVCALYSSLHCAQLQVGLSQPIRLGQAKTVKVKNKKKFCVYSLR